MDEFMNNQCPYNNSDKDSEYIVVNKSDLKELTTAVRFLIHLTDHALLVPCNLRFLACRVNEYSHRLFKDEEQNNQ